MTQQGHRLLSRDLTHQRQYHPEAATEQMLLAQRVARPSNAVSTSSRGAAGPTSPHPAGSSDRRAARPLPNGSHMSTERAATSQQDYRNASNPIRDEEDPNKHRMGDHDGRRPEPGDHTGDDSDGRYAKAIAPGSLTKASTWHSYPASQTVRGPPQPGRPPDRTLTEPLTGATGAVSHSRSDRQQTLAHRPRDSGVSSLDQHRRSTSTASSQGYRKDASKEPPIGTGRGSASHSRTYHDRAGQAGSSRSEHEGQHNARRTSMSIGSDRRDSVSGHDTAAAESLKVNARAAVQRLVNQGHSVESATATVRQKLARQRQTSTDSDDSDQDGQRESSSDSE